MPFFSFPPVQVASVSIIIGSPTVMWMAIETFFLSNVDGCCVLLFLLASSRAVAKLF
jgi:hypothetical protein